MQAVAILFIYIKNKTKQNKNHNPSIQHLFFFWAAEQLTLPRSFPTGGSSRANLQHVYFNRENRPTEACKPHTTIYPVLQPLFYWHITLWTSWKLDRLSEKRWRDPQGDVEERSEKKGDRWKGSRVRCHDSSRGVRTASQCQGDPISQRPRWADVGKSG